MDGVNQQNPDVTHRGRRKYFLPSPAKEHVCVEAPTTGDIDSQTTRDERKVEREPPHPESREP